MALGLPVIFFLRFTEQSDGLVAERPFGIATASFLVSGARFFAANLLTGGKRKGRG